ncbi:paxneb superfamily protein-like protein [Dendryphion nanum]|uniref:Elongator complex protein 4 n=1 Tax=Dendryphion nanum TaxID=256645 RepID=A0A9P9DBL5_9PLEO|nr:paxneb superfamily protein-like protein [Dendryphion nanum]
MAFRKRNVVLSRPDHTSESPSSPSSPSTPEIAPSSPGVRPSPIDGRPTTSTGTPSLDALLAGHAGLPLGNSILIGETGTTDYAGALVRFYAAEGVVQGHYVHVVGMGEGWGRELPGISESKEESRRREKDEKMKIAWRYEGLGEFGSNRGPNRIPAQTTTQNSTDASPTIFCHTFDLAKRLSHPSTHPPLSYIPIPSSRTTTTPSLIPILHSLQTSLATTPPHTIHRLVLPSLLSPALYPPSTSHPHTLLPFLHALRALLRAHPTRLTALITLPLTLYPRSTGLIRWTEHLSDAVFELSPFPYNSAQILASSGAATKEEDKPQGLFAVHKLPVWSEKGGGSVVEGLGEDLAFSLSRRRFVVQKFSLPPVEGDAEAQGQHGEGAKEHEGKLPRKEDLEF